jgi:hypothetical protein
MQRQVPRRRAQLRRHAAPSQLPRLRRHGRSLHRVDPVAVPVGKAVSLGCSRHEQQQRHAYAPAPHSRLQSWAAFSATAMAAATVSSVFAGVGARAVFTFVFAEWPTFSWGGTAASEAFAPRWLRLAALRLLAKENWG